jgi:hypothetical protein
MSKRLKIGQRVHYHDDPQDKGTVDGVRVGRWGVRYNVRWDGEASPSVAQYRPEELITLDEDES